MKLNQNQFALRSFRLPSPDVEIWKSAAASLKISQSEFLRRALREKAHAAIQLVGEKSERTEDQQECAE